MPSKPIERSYAGPGLLARIATAKFAEHIPHYRQSEINRRQDADLSRATLDRWSGTVSELLRQYVLMPGKVHTDDILCGCTCGANITPDRKVIRPQQHLAEYGDILQADAYGGHNALYEDGRITEAACMAHARREVHDVHARTPTDIATEALRRIGELYTIEAEIRGGPADERVAVRKEQTVPPMQSLYD